MPFSRRDFMRLSAGAGAVATLNQLASSAAVAQSSNFRAMVGIFLFGGSDNWNMIVPMDGRYSTYAAGRGSGIALPASSLSALSGTAFGLHPSFAPLQTAWAEGALNAVFNVGTLQVPVAKAQYRSNPEILPLALMSHEDQQNEWQGLRMRSVNNDGFMGRQNDREVALSTPDLISIAGSTLSLIGNSSSPLILPSSGTIVRNGFNGAATDAVTTTRQSALTAFSDGGAYGPTTQVTGAALNASYAQATLANTIVSSTTSAMDQYFKNSAGATLTSDVSRQLLRTARMIEARGTLGHSRQTFFVSQGGYDTHSNQVNSGSPATGTQANLFADLAQALAAFYAAMKALGMQNNVTAFTMSDFGRTFKGNAQLGTDHAWGNNHLVLGGAVRDRTLQGTYPDVTLGGVQDIDNANLGRWIPSTAIEEYIGPIAQWYGVSDLSYVFPNWSTWTSNGRGPLPLFG
jgi:uncharacterized protein (DUF1501 family)